MQTSRKVLGLAVLGLTVIAVVALAAEPDSGITWEQYIKDCGIEAQKLDQTRSAQVFKDKYEGKTVTWSGTVDSVSDKNGKKEITVRMDPTEPAAGGADVTLIALPEFEQKVKSLQKGDKITFSGRIITQRGPKTGHVLELSALEVALRWKFEKGEKLDYNMVQDMTIGSKGGPQGDQNVTMHQELDMTWDVQDVNAEGNAVIQQKVDRVQMKMTLPPPMGAIEYDTSAAAEPTGPAAMFAPLYKAMTQGAFTITMTPRGEIRDVKIPEEVATAIKNSPGMAQMGEMATAEGFKKMMSQGSLVLPEKAPQKDESWSTKIEVNNPMAGKQVVETTYRYEDTKEVDGATYAVFRPTIKMSFEGSPVKITEQTSGGEILFNVAEGRLDSSSLAQQVTIDQPGGMKMTIDQDVAVKVKPAGAESEARSTESEQ